MSVRAAKSSSLQLADRFIRVLAILADTLANIPRDILSDIAGSPLCRIELNDG
jgi:hypothetical protein